MSKYSSVKKYEFFEQIEHDSTLAFFFNKVFKNMDLARIISSPKSFNESSYLKSRKKRKKYNNDTYKMFYQTCLFEMYAHAVIKKLEDWQKIIHEYLSEFNGSWEYYARSKRIDMINKYGGDDDDYDDNGNIVKNVPDDKLLSYSIILDLIPDDWRDIVIETKPDDLEYISRYISLNSSFSIKDMAKSIGFENLKTYRMQNGVMVENTEDDELLHSIENTTKSENATVMLLTICMIINQFVKEINTLQKDEDNKEFLSVLLSRIQNLFDMDIKSEITKLQIELEK
ncbi:hypothetical protein JGH11_16040 [Dysgonomonas sp. Marseille-P4677]|uniref:hypothetical protein n=1 Tax=Dysgonomonas sp. Marseille-P4677 TaxID=2364790 RepID=UPI0019148F96|nr:hypothetical protein [Dysgonomonas sp. Marseille-P4677]MBK5722387.1 hypothetical protein [Dysgonomonas sp. Marseille-P4677]